LNFIAIKWLTLQNTASLFTFFTQYTLHLHGRSKQFVSQHNFML